MRSVQLSLMALVAAVPSAKSLELDRTQWAGPGLFPVRATLMLDGAGYRLQTDNPSALSYLFSTIKPGTLLLRLRMETDTAFRGTAYTYSSPDPATCTFAYSVEGRIDNTVITWSGHEPVERANTCRVTRTLYTTRSLQRAAAPIASREEPKRTPSVAQPQSTHRPQAVSKPPMDFAPSNAEMAALAVAGVLLLPPLYFVVRYLELKARNILADIRVALAEKRAQLSQLAPTLGAQGAMLSPAEIEDILAVSFPDIEPHLRAALARTLAAALKDKANA